MSGASIDLEITAEVGSDEEQMTHKVADLLEEHVKFLRTQPKVAKRGLVVHKAGTIKWDADIIYDRVTP